MTENNTLEWTQISEYIIRTIGIKSDVDITRVKGIFSLGRKLCPEDLRAIFISNYVESDGNEQFKDLWLFSDNYVIEALNFARVPNPKLEMTILKTNLMYTSVEAKDYIFGETTQKGSTFHVAVATLTRFQCDMLAAGQNCDTLRDIYERYLKSNLARGGYSLVL